jgi:hypothetical protein
MLTQNGSQVTGDDGNGDQLTGTVSGNTFTGRWTHGTDFGAVTATMDPSCNSFTGFVGLNGSTSVTSGSGQSFNRTRVGGSTPTTTTTTPPTTNNGQLQKLGGVDLSGYCRSLGYTGVSLDGGTINDWHCVDSSGRRVGIDVGAACRWQYHQSGAVGRWDTFNDPNSWNCFGMASSGTSNYSLWTADMSGNTQQYFSPGDSFRIYAGLPQYACVWISVVRPDGTSAWDLQNSCNNAGTWYWNLTFGTETGWRHFYLWWQDTSGWETTDAWVYAG